MAETPTEAMVHEIFNTQKTSTFIVAALILLARRIDELEAAINQPSGPRIGG